jgi:hypothetical protein
MSLSVLRGCARLGLQEGLLPTDDSRGNAEVSAAARNRRIGKNFQ